MDWLFNQITMKISLIFCFIVSAKKHEKQFDSKSLENMLTQFPFFDGDFDFRGEVRKRFALEAAMMEPHLSMICSPVSVWIPLANLAMGAKGNTEQELMNAIGISKTNQLFAAIANVLQLIKYVEGVTIEYVSRIYISTQADIKHGFEKNTKFVLGSSIQKFNASNPRKVVKTINEWVAKNTRHKITYLVSESDITEDTSLLLVNAIHFSGRWRHKFEKKLTKQFHSPMGSRQISMMSREGVYNYWMSDELDAQVIEIPYELMHVMMIIVLPISTRGLTHLLQNLKRSPAPLNSALANVKATNIKLTIPRFKIQTTLDLNPLFKTLGVNSIFSRNSELSKIIKNHTVFVSKAIHKAVIDVDEVGTKGDTASGVVIGLLSSLSTPKPIEFTATHPFYFIIRMNQEQLFAGTFNGG